ncbi:type II toxin-antitoxin system RelE/ParE family toxin [Pantoea dispersa]|uniref:type II toxin-antitoxin system RelE/ParE family toxin n=1 Tax=Pantoea dispersa TaxID=59814 RepID=UPI003AF1C629
MWLLDTTDLFAEWLKEQDRAMQLDVLAALNLLKQEGPYLGRPHVDTPYSSKIPNMKELRVQNNGRPVKEFFVFDPMG